MGTKNPYNSEGKISSVISRLQKLYFATFGILQFLSITRSVKDFLARDARDSEGLPAFFDAHQIGFNLCNSSIEQ